MDQGAGGSPGAPIVRLVACQGCHAHFDVTRVTRARFPCACGEVVVNRPHEPLDLPVHRCAACGAALDEGAQACSYCEAPVVRDPSRLGLVCPACFARTVEGGRFCVGCGVAIRPRPVREDERSLDCPACEAPLGAVSLDRIVLHECAGCGGSWVPSDDFDAVVARIQASSEPSAFPRLGSRPTIRIAGEGTSISYRRCPECAEIMHRRNFGRSSGVVVDWCRAHGTWLDRAELEAVAAFVRRGGLDDRPRS